MTEQRLQPPGGNREFLLHRIAEAAREWAEDRIPKTRSEKQLMVTLFDAFPNDFTTKERCACSEKDDCDECPTEAEVRRAIADMRAECSEQFKDVEALTLAAVRTAGAPADGEGRGVMFARDRGHDPLPPLTPGAVHTPQADLVAMVVRDNDRMRKAGLRLAAAALHVIAEHDGLHRLSLAVAEWARAVADEGDRGERHAAPARDAEPRP